MTWGTSFLAPPPPLSFCFPSENGNRRLNGKGCKAKLKNLVHGRCSKVGVAFTHLTLPTVVCPQTQSLSLPGLYRMRWALLHSAARPPPHQSCCTSLQDWQYSVPGLQLPSGGSACPISKHPGPVCSSASNIWMKPYLKESAAVLRACSTWNNEGRCR